VNEVQSQTWRCFIASSLAAEFGEDARKLSRQLTQILTSGEAENQNLQDMLAKSIDDVLAFTVQAIS
jgi:hypothetical protein